MNAANVAMPPSMLARSSAFDKGCGLQRGRLSTGNRQMPTSHSSETAPSGRYRRDTDGCSQTSSARGPRERWTLVLFRACRIMRASLRARPPNAVAHIAIIFRHARCSFRRWRGHEAGAILPWREGFNQGIQVLTRTGASNSGSGIPFANSGRSTLSATSANSLICTMISTSEAFVNRWLQIADACAFVFRVSCGTRRRAKPSLSIRRSRTLSSIPRCSVELWSRSQAYFENTRNKRAISIAVLVANIQLCGRSVPRTSENSFST